MENINKIHTEYIEVEVDSSKKAAVILENKLHLANYRVIDEHLIRIYEQDVPQQESSKTLIMLLIAYLAIRNIERVDVIK